MYGVKSYLLLQQSHKLSYHTIMYGVKSYYYENKVKLYILKKISCSFKQNKQIEQSNHHR